MSSVKRLGDLLTSSGGSIKTGPFGTALKADEYSDTGVPIISVGEVGYGALRLRHDTPMAPAEVTSRLPEYLLCEGDIVFGRKGAVDRSAWVKNTEAGWFLGSDGIRVRLPQDVDSRFVAYQFQSDSVRSWLLQHASGSTMLSLNQKILERVPLHLPTMADQRAIVEVLGALDDKIAVNNRASVTSEELTHTSYRLLSSSALTEPIKVENLVTRISPERKFSRSDLSHNGDFPVLDQSEEGFLGYSSGPGFIDAHPGRPVLYFGDHTCKLRIVDEKFGVGPNTIPFISKTIPSLTLYYALRDMQSHEEYKRHWQLLMKKEVSIPILDRCVSFADRFGSSLGLVRSLRNENRVLAATRDALLPQLMSGKLRVREAEALVEELV